MVDKDKIGCQNCKHKRITEGFIECGAIWEQPFEHVMNLLRKERRHANGYDFALAYGKFRNDCPYFEKKKGLFK